MNDRSKAIQEMAHKLCKSKSPCIECLKRSRDAGIFVNKTDCVCYLHAKILSKHYQPNLPNGSVVLSEEEYESLEEYREEMEEIIKYREKKARKQAIKEFAHTLIKECELFDLSDDIFYVSLLKDIRRIAISFGVDL